MGVQVTTPTDLPVDGDGSHDQLTWAETGGALSVPALEGPGYAAGVVLPQNDVDYEWRQAGRHSRATVNRTVMSDEGFLSSCILYQGAFNVGGGTLSVTLAPSRVGVDADDDGGVALEVKIPAGSPLVLTASKDTYVNLKEDGSVEIQEVPNSDPAPTPSADYVAIWVLVSDGTELTAANLADGIAPFPCLGTATAGIGIRKAIIEDLTITTIAELPLSDSGATVPQSEGAIRYNGTFWTVRDQLGSHTISEPIRKWSTGFTVSSGTADTSTTLVRRIQAAEQAWFKLTFRYENDVASKPISVDINYTSSAGNGSILSTSVYADVADEGYTAAIEIDWSPSDDAIATEESYTFTVNLGTPLGILSADFIALTASSNFEV